MITDPTGSVIPGVTVTIRNVATGVSRAVETSSAGVYAATNLQPGTYLISVTAPGFATSQRSVELGVGQRLGADITLEVGKAETVVTVNEVGATVNTETQTLQQTVTTKQILELPSLTRNPYDFVASVGNVTPDAASARGVGYAINGQRSSSTNIMLDGTSNNDEFSATVGQTVPLDAVQEYSVLTSNFTAEYGRASGGVVNVLTKSGSNEWHGTAYEFNRVSRLASNNFENNANGIAKPVFTRNQFGYSVGGPVAKNKLFVFNSTEWIRVRSQANRQVYIPTQQLLTASAPAVQQFFSTYGKLRPGINSLGNFSRSQLQSRGFDPCRIGSSFGTRCSALPADLPLFQRLSYSYPSDSGGGLPQNTWMSVTRADYNLSDKTQIYGRYAIFDELDFAGTVSDSPFAGYDTPNTQRNHSAVLSVTHSFTPSLVSQTKADFNRFNNQQPLGEGALGPTLYLGSGNAATTMLGDLVALPGYLPFSPGSAIPFGGPQNYIQFYQDTSWIKGKHSFRFGGTYTYLRDNRTFGAYAVPVNQVGNSFGRGIENLLAGQLFQYSAAIDPQGKYPCGATPTPDCTVNLPVGFPNFSRSNRYNDYALYGQDSWKISRRVTVNLGLRWEVFGTQHNKNPKLDSNFYLGSGSNIYQQIANGSVMIAQNSPIGKLWKTDLNNFAPRVGIAWDVFGDGRTSLRGGYGIGYERNFGNVTFNVIQNPPNYAVINLVAGQDVPTIPITSSLAGPLAGNTGTKALPRVSLRGVNPNIDTAYAHFYSASLEHRLAEGVVAAIEYSGSAGRDQYGISNVNRAGAAAYYLGTPCTPGTEGDLGTCTDRLRATQYGAINFRTNGGFADYNAMNLRLEIQNFANSGLTLRSNYTWSHAIDTLSDTFSSSGNNYNLGWLDPFNPKYDKGDALYDTRQRFTLAAIYEIGAGRSWGSNAMRQIAGGWTIAPIFTARTGQPFSLYDCTFGWNACPYAMFNGKPSGTSTGMTATEVPNTWNYIDVSKVKDSSWFNPKMGVSDFGPFPSNMIGRNAFRRPGFWNLDFGLYKSFAFGEVKRLQFRGEAYNMFNHANLDANIGDADVSSIDFVTASRSGRRNIQLGLKFIF